MDAIEHLQTSAWKHPRDYGGFSPDGDFVLIAQTRDSSALDRSNWRRICEDLNAEAYDDGAARFEQRPAVYHWRAGHWACGWCEYLMIRSDAPAEVQTKAGEILCALADYPVYDESDFSDLEYTEAAEYWAGMRVSDRYEAIKRSASDVSIFAARRADLPSDDNGALLQYLNGN